MTSHAQLWKVGELAKRTGLTVRTLHHYDQIGLLRPSGRTGSAHASGHRLYLSLIHISEPTRQEAIAYAVFCL